jgi:zinc/manganese transport system permease protein
VVTALVLVLMLGTGALFLSLSTQYAQVTYSLLFGEVFGVSSNVLLPIAALGAVSVAAVAVLYRPLLLASALPEVADARGVSTRRMELCFLIVMALATSMTVPVVGALLMFALMIGPSAAARSFTRHPGHAIAVTTGIALVTVWAGIALSYRTNWPLGFFVGVIAAGFFLLGLGWTAVRRRGSAPAPGGPRRADPAPAGKAASAPAGHPRHRPALAPRPDRQQVDVSAPDGAGRHA